MSLEQHINWTVLPAGLSDDGTQVRVSVFVAPRLQPEGTNATLAEFPDFLRWPEKIMAATFEFATADGSVTPPVPASFTGALAPQGPAPDMDLWTSLFHEGTPLEPYSGDAPQRDMRSYSAQEVRGFTKRVYGTAAKDHPEAPPRTNDLLRAQSAALVGEGPTLATAAEGGPDVSRDGAVPQELANLEAFHRPSNADGSATGVPPGAESLAPVQPPADGQPGAGPEEPSRQPSLDFHTMLTSLGDHPVLLRRLGLVLDFVLPADLPESVGGERLLTVIPRWDPQLGPRSHDVPCFTRYFFGVDPLPSNPPAPGRRLFLPAQPQTGGDPLASPSRGLVALTATDFSVEQGDVDGAALKMLRAPEDARGLSPMRAQGISLIRNSRMGVLQEELGRADEHNQAFNEVVGQQRTQREQPPGGEAGGPGAAEPAPADGQHQPTAPILAAKDLVRGHRIDIWDEQRRSWFSLHAREVEYRRPEDGPLLLTAADEGFFQAHLVSPPNDAALYVPEPLAVWRGWSLSAPRPGLLLDTAEGDPDNHEAPNAPVAPRNEAPPGLPLEIVIKAARGSLPPLRYGHAYRVRLRTVDLAGNGLSLRQADALMHLPDLAAPERPLVFQRFEAVPAPAVAPRRPLAEGASTFRMVIRSSPGDRPPPAAPPDTVGGGTRVVVLANVRHHLTNEDIRVVQSALMAMGHPLLGGADGDFGDQTKAAYAAEQRSQGFSGSDADGTPGCQSLTELGRKAGFTVDCGPGSQPAPTTGITAESYAAEFNRSSLVTDQGHVPYQGVDERHVVAPKTSLQCVEWHGLLDEAIGSTDHAVQDAIYELAVRESGSLDDPGPDVRLEPVDSPAADPDHPAVTALHTGEQVDMRGLPDPLARGAALFDLPGMPAGQPFLVPWDGDVWHRPKSFRLRLAEGTGPPHFDEASRVLTVSLPKGAVATVRVCSGIDFDADLMGMASWSRAAAGESEAERTKTDRALELAAENRHWMFTPWHELTLVHAVQKPLKTPVLHLPPPTEERAQNATAEHLAGTIALDENSTGRIDLVAEWSEVTDEGPDGTVTRTMTAPVFGLLTARAVPTGTPGPDPVLLRDGVLTFSTKAAEDKVTADGVPPLLTKHEFGDTKHRVVRYRPLAGSRFGDYFPLPFAEPGRGELTVQGAAQEYSVPSSAAPTAPRVLYCVPTLSLDQADGPSGAIVRRRRGGGIRVYLGRPWFSSGEGELLGVVLGEPPGGDPTSARDAWVTLMGRDPIHRSAPVVAPTPDVFTNAVGPPKPLVLSAPSGPLPVTVVGFAPQFDPDEKGGRWFCDLELDTGDTCLPFVRLALVRYQPHSIPGAEISPVVLADVVRTLPDRELTVSPGRPLSVSLTGPSWDPTGSLPPQITATLQRRHGVIGDEDLGWVTLEDTVTPLTSVDAESSHTPSYRGEIDVAQVRRGAPLRLLVMETEGIPTDGPTPFAPQGPVIYCDTVDLPSGHDGHHDDRRHGGRDDDGEHGRRDGDGEHGRRDGDGGFGGLDGDGGFGRRDGDGGFGGHGGPDGGR
ncbi:peptidoglycan-binding domain-containing protein [Streptomyces sp. SAI-170]|uniref:peptidoglycan-binding domain-containing protein n=1 Tax=Streptomyces sp. SAI-170 TaxID=3377729 RepID=UPI003C79F7B7